MSVFVTVGTTSFDSLIATVCNSTLKQLLQDLGYTKLVVQYGRGAYEPVNVKTDKLITEVFRYKDSIAKDIFDASLVISHAGAGSCLEVLGAGKKLIVVINEDLMDNHQFELAKQLYEEGHLLYCTPETLRNTIESIQDAKLKPFPIPETQKFGTFVDSFLGFT